MINPRISIYKSATDTAGETITLLQALEIIKSDAHKNAITALRKASAESREKLKKLLPAVTWSGLFSKRSKAGLEEYSGIISHDIDKLSPEDLTRLKAEFANDLNIYACFTSPSGNGLKLLFVTSATSETHAQYWNAIGSYLVNTYGIEIDVKCKDVSRLCFLSYDPEMIYHDTYFQIGEAFLATNEYKPEKKPAPVAKTSTETATNLFDKCHQITEKTQQAVEGNYNQYINVFCLQANRYGLNKADVIEHLENRYGTENNPTWVKSVAESVYTQFATEHGKYLENKSSGGNNRGRGAAAKTAPAPGQPNDIDDSVVFWEKYSTKVNSDGDPIWEYKYSYQKAVRFLMNNGFGKIRLANNNFQFVRIQQNVVEVVNERIMKEFMLGYLNQNITKDKDGKYTDFFDPLYLVREMFMKGAKTYCSTSQFEALDYLDNLEFKTDTPECIYLYFNNCFVEIKKDGHSAQPYTRLNGLIWKRQIIDRDFTHMPDFVKSEFNVFLQLAVCDATEKQHEGQAVMVVNHDEVALQKFDSAKTSIGYAISRYKNRAIAKAVVFVDKKLRHGGNESNGGSGKGIIGGAIAKVRNAINIDGKTFKFDSNFPYTMISEDHEVVHFEDVRKGFDIEMLFNPITGGWEIRRLHENSYQIPFEKSAKIIISTNFSLKGTGSSFLRRQHIIELSNFFNEKYSPLDHFGHLLFDDWNTEEWNRFYSFIIHCCSLHMQKGLVEFPLENYGTNKLIDAAGEEFVDWMDEKFNPAPETSEPEAEAKTVYAFNTRYIRNEIFQAFKADFPNNRKYSQMDRTNTWSGWVKEWCTQRNIELKEKKSGTTYYWTFLRHK